MTRPKPDNRADNVAHLQNHISNSIENYNEAEDYLAEHADEISANEVSEIQAKNHRRLESIKGFRKEIKDEAGHAGE